jgi:hypothetical protein
MGSGPNAAWIHDLVVCGATAPTLMAMNSPDGQKAKSSKGEIDGSA